jgi:hypothetical protein
MHTPIPATWFSAARWGLEQGSRNQRGPLGELATPARGRTPALGRDQSRLMGTESCQATSIRPAATTTDDCVDRKPLTPRDACTSWPIAGVLGFDRPRTDSTRPRAALELGSTRSGRGMRSSGMAVGASASSAVAASRARQRPDHREVFRRGPDDPSTGPTSTHTTSSRYAWRATCWVSQRIRGDEQTARTSRSSVWTPITRRLAPRTPHVPDPVNDWSSTLGPGISTPEYRRVRCAARRNSILHRHRCCVPTRPA